MIVDPIADSIENSNYKRYYGTEELINISTYQNDKISTEDIMFTFLSQCKLHRQRHFLCAYKVFTGSSEQNYAWSVRTTKETYGWGSIFNIRFHFSNGWLLFSTSAKNFSSGGESSVESSLYFDNYRTRLEIAFNHLEKLLISCRDEAIITWRKYGKNAEGNFPFNYYSMLNDKKKGKASTDENSNDTNSLKIITFYRNLLGLKLHFSSEELKIAYREAIKKYHPDSYGSSSPRDRANAETLMKQIIEANEFLKRIVA
ncbi:MAG: J domain-containing protein [Treponema sp.]|nr:J domain-containing protein [Treponema sp.]